MNKISEHQVALQREDKTHTGTNIQTIQNTSQNILRMSVRLQPLHIKALHFKT